jgi:hypothetical protein
MSDDTIDGAAMDAASEADRRWFARRPDRRTRIRPFMPGEVPVLEMAGDMRMFVIVRQVTPGVRVRVPIRLARAPKNNEQEAQGLFNRFFGGQRP